MTGASIEPKTGKPGVSDEHSEQDDGSNLLPIERCRQLLGDEARDLSDEGIEAIRRHAHAIAHTLTELFLQQASASGLSAWLQKLLTFCRTNKGRVNFVVVFNLTRFARDKYDHFALRSLPFQRSIDIDTYDHAERLREELTLGRIAKHSTKLDELDVEGILAFAERGFCLRAADLWVQAPLEQRRRFRRCSSRREWPSTAGGSLEPRQPPRLQLLREIRTSGDGLVGPAGLEPATSRL